MRDITLRYVDETYDEDGLLKTYKLKYPENFNFGYDIVDDIAEHEPDKVALVWDSQSGEEHTFTFGDIKRMSDKVANFLTSQGIGKGDVSPSPAEIRLLPRDISTICSPRSPRWQTRNIPITPRPTASCAITRNILSI